VSKFECKILRRYNILSNLMTHLHLSLSFFFALSSLPPPSTCPPRNTSSVVCTVFWAKVSLLNRRGIVRVVKDGITIFWAEVGHLNLCRIVCVTSRWHDTAASFASLWHRGWEERRCSYDCGDGTVVPVGSLLLYLGVSWSLQSAALIFVSSVIFDGF
jgi:hypothetical protein